MPVSNIIYPMNYEKRLGDTKPFSKARYKWQLHLWFMKVKKAKENKDYLQLDHLHKIYELIGLP